MVHPSPSRPLLRCLRRPVPLPPRAAAAADAPPPPPSPSPPLSLPSDPASFVQASADHLFTHGDFAAIDRNVRINLERIQHAFAAARVGPHHFGGSTGYGHEDMGKEVLEEVFAHIVGAEAALVRTHFQSGTHAIACALYAVCRPGTELVALAGRPYDTMEEVVGIRGTPGHGSLKEFGVSYREVRTLAQPRPLCPSPIPRRGI